MHSFVFASILLGAFASPFFGQGPQKVLDDTSFCDGANMRATQAPRAASAFCSAFLEIPTVTVNKTIATVVRTITKTTSTRTYLAYPVTVETARTITATHAVTGTSTKTITTSIYTETAMRPLPGCPTAQITCGPQQTEVPATLADARPSCFSTYSESSNLSKACSCIDVETSTTTRTVTKAGAPTSTTTIQAAGKTTRTITKTITTGTVTLTPTYGVTVTEYVAAIETEILHGPFKLASGSDYRLKPENGWAWSFAPRAHDIKAQFGGSSDCASSYFALNGTQLLTQYQDGRADFPPYSLIGNVMTTAGQNSNPVLFSSLDRLTTGRARLSSKIEPSMDEANPHAACPLTCSYAGAGGGRSTLREDRAWYMGGEEGDWSSFTMYAYQYLWR